MAEMVVSLSLKEYYKRYAEFKVPELFMKSRLFLTLLFCFVVSFSIHAQGIGQVSPPLETPIRFQVDVLTNHPQSDQSPLYEKDWGVLILPKQYKSDGKPVPLVIACHGGGGTVHANGSQIESLDMYKYLVSLGYAVMDMAGMPETFSKRKKIDHNRSMGSFITVRSFDEGYRWVMDRYNIDSRGCYITGGSNGGLTVMNVASHSSIPIVRIAASSPSLSLREQAWNSRSGAISGGQFPAWQNRSNIMRIYDMEDVTNYNKIFVAEYDEARVEDYDPFTYKVASENGILKKELPYPIKIWHPVDDNILSIDFSRKFVDAVNNGGGEAYLIEMTGGGHSPHTYGEKIGYFSYKGEDIALKQLAYEQAVWFGKHSNIHAVYHELKKPQPPLEAPIRFQVNVSTNHPQSGLAPVYEKDWGVLILPRQYRSDGKPVPLVIACHGGGGTVHANGSQTENSDMYLYLVSLGYAVMDMAGMPETFAKRLKIDQNRAMGSYIAVRSYKEGYKWVLENYNISQTGGYIAGGSNGGLTSTNVVSHSSIPILAHAASSPVLNVRDQAWSVVLGANSGGQFPAFQNRSNLIRIYGMEDVRGYNEIFTAKYDSSKVGIYDPFVFNMSQESGKYKKVYPCPIRIWHPLDDNIVPISFSRQFVNAIQNAGGIAELVEMSDGGHDSHKYGEDIGYFIYRGTKKGLKQVPYEQALFFERFGGIKPAYQN